MIVAEAYHMPGLRPEDVARWEVRDYAGGAVRLRIPVLEPRALERMVDGIRRAREEYLVDRPVDEVIRAIDRAASRLARHDDPARVLAERALPAVTGYSPSMIRLILERMVPDWREPSLRTLLRVELGDPGVLDGFRALPGDLPARSVRAYGPVLAFHIFAGNVPGVAVTSLVRSLLVKAATLGKTASGDPLLPALFARTLAEVSPELGACLAVTYWPGGNDPLEAVAFEAAESVVVYGGPETIGAVRSRVPTGVRLVEHGPRLSLAMVGREALSASRVARTAASAARAVAVFDQQGCVSPHLIYVERGGETAPEAFARLVAEAMHRLEAELPRGSLSAAEAATIQQLRGATEFRSFGDPEVRLFASEGTAYTVIFEPDPAFVPSCLNRVVRVKPLDRLEDAATHLRPVAGFLQTVGLVGAEARRRELAEALGRSGSSRITDLDRMPWPPPTWHHDGRDPVRELVRWVDLEE